MAKQTWVNVSGTWREVVDAWVNVNGEWKNNVMPKGVVSGDWKEFMEYFTERFYFFSQDRVFAIDPTGNVIFEKVIFDGWYGGGFENLAADKDGNFCLAGNHSGNDIEGFIYVYDKNGNLKWESGEDSKVLSHVFDNDGNLLATMDGSNDTSIFDANTGSEKFIFNPGGNWAEYRMTMDEYGYFYVSYGNGDHIVKVDPDVGEVWRSNLDISTDNFPNILAFGGYIFLRRGSRIYKIDASDGSQISSYNWGETIRDMKAHDNHIFITSVDSYVTKLTTDLEEVDVFDTGPWDGENIAIIPSGIMAVSRSSNNVVLFDLNTRQTIDSLYLGDTGTGHYSLASSPGIYSRRPSIKEG